MLMRKWRMFDVHDEEIPIRMTPRSQSIYSRQGSDAGEEMTDI